MKGKNKRNLFKELKAGLEEIQAHQSGMITLRTYSLKKPRPKVNDVLIRELRKKYNMSRTVFAHKLRVSPRTLEKWEQGETIPNDQAAALILMVQKYPDTLKRLEEI
ncbi:MAG: helix-turn-helix domain-containing protein [Candidatus Berkiellales bacterium]